jgi:hypothetical protein
VTRGFRALENETTRLYEAGELRSALELLDARAGEFSATGHRCKIAFFRACLMAQLGDPDAALDVLEAALDDGLWWSAAMLADSDLDRCRGSRLDRIAAAAPDVAESPVRLVDPAEQPIGSLLALHGGGEVVVADDNPWAPALAEGWTVIRPASTQRVGAGLATWTDLDRAVDECRAHLDEIGPIDAIGSFSLGASLALRLITEIVRVPTIMIAPSLRPEVVESAAPHAAGAAIEIVTGKHDPFMGRTEHGVARLRDAGAVVHVEIVPQLGHDFPPNFDRLLSSRLSEITGRSRDEH